MASLKYFLLRAVLFVVPFAVFMVLRIGVVLSAIYAVLIAFAINFLFLTRQRNAAASEVRDVFGGRKQVRSKRELADAEVEDALDEAQRADQEAEYEGAEGDENPSAEGNENPSAEGGKGEGGKAEGDRAQGDRAEGDTDVRGHGALREPASQGRKTEDRRTEDRRTEDRKAEDRRTEDLKAQDSGEQGTAS
ncbi:DUF4229 domain-containing protein [Sinomonas atrocyanea]